MTTNLNKNFDVNDYDASKRKYLVGLNLFNRKPEKGIDYLIKENFLDPSPRAIAEFLFNRNCLSKLVIGEYIGNTQDRHVKSVLGEYVSLIDLSNLPVDEALRKFQSHFRMPGEAQKIEHLTQNFSKRYIECNEEECKRLFSSAENSLDVLAYAIIMLNTSIHNPNVKPTEKMKFEQFLKMTKGIDNGKDIEKEYLHGIYERVKENEFKPSKDHTTSVIEFEKNLVGPNKPPAPFSLPHRRLVCLVQLYEIYDLTKKANQHPRECFLFNDILVITKIFSKRKSHALYSYKSSISLNGLSVALFSTNDYKFGIKLFRTQEKLFVINFNAKNQHDQLLFYKDLKESIAESNDIEELKRNSDKLSKNLTQEPTTTLMAYLNNQKSSDIINNNHNLIESSSLETKIVFDDRNFDSFKIDYRIKDDTKTVSSNKSSTSSVVSSSDNSSNYKSCSTIHSSNYKEILDEISKSTASQQQVTPKSPASLEVKQTSSMLNVNASTVESNFRGAPVQTKLQNKFYSPITAVNKLEKPSQKLSRLNSSLRLNTSLNRSESESRLNNSSFKRTRTTQLSVIGRNQQQQQQLDHQKNDKNNNCFNLNDKVSHNRDIKNLVSNFDKIDLKSANALNITNSNASKISNFYYHKNLTKTSIMKSANSTSHMKQAFSRISSNNQTSNINGNSNNSLEKNLIKPKVSSPYLINKINIKSKSIDFIEDDDDSKNLIDIKNVNNTTSASMGQKNAKYFTISSSAGQKFRKILSKYV